MIARLSGILAEASSDSAVIDVGGVGYLVHLSTRALDVLGPVGGQVLLLTELQVREDAWTLFGFGSAQERDSFRALTSIQGVGGRLALAILSALSPDELARAVSQDDKAMIGRANGVGPKLALRLVTELKDKAPAMMLAGGEGGPYPHAVAAAPRGAEADAVAALLKLGYSESIAATAVAKAANDLGEAEAGVLIREALRGMGK